MPLARHDFDWRAIGICVFVSTHMPLARHDAMVDITFYTFEKFLLTCLLRGMTRNSLFDMSGVNSFLLTCLLRGMTIVPCFHFPVKGRFYSHASCEA